jgi:hypothetical protein
MANLHIAVAGLGNTGTNVVPHLARMPEVSQLTLIDPQTYEAANVAVQNIDIADVGQPKAAAQAARIKRIRPDLDVTAIEARIEDVPRGKLRCDLIVSCLDSKLARQHVNEIAWRLNIPWIDCGVLGSQSLVRVNAYVPGSDGPCLECAWNPGEGGDYALLEQEYLCGATGAAFPTMATSALGALAASLVVVEIAKYARDGREALAASKQLVFDAEHHIAQLTSQCRNPCCRFDHAVWSVKPWVCRLSSTTVREALTELGSLRVEGHHFVTEQVCPGCGYEEHRMRLNRPLARCPECKRRLAPVGAGPVERLEPKHAGSFLAMTLGDMGLEAGDIVSCSRGQLELTEEA